MANNNYSLTISELKTSKGTPSIELTYMTPAEVIKIEQTAYVSCQLCDFNYSKEIYRPGRLQFTLLLIPQGQAAVTIDKVYDIFDSCKVQLKAGEFEIAKNYYIFNIQLERRKSTQGGGQSTIQTYAVFEAYSPDQYLTLDKYCKAYTGRKLFADIISDTSHWPDAITAFRQSGSLNNLLIQDLQFLSYKVAKAESATSENPSYDTYEYIQPYLVQYNESFYDFLVRVTNRCGEFLYYEDGKFHVGWTNPGSSVAVTDYISVRYVQGRQSAWNAASLGEVHNDYAQNKNCQTNSNATVLKDSDVASDENLTPLPPKAEYTTWKDYSGGYGVLAISTLNSALSEQNLVNIVGTFALKLASSIKSSIDSSASANDKYKSKNFSETCAAERVYAKERVNVNDRQGNEDKYGIYPYSSTPHGETVVFSLQYYSGIQRGIESAEASRIHVVLENNFYPICLGSLIHFDDTDKQYIVVKINHAVTRVSAVNAAPMAASSGGGSGNTQTATPDGEMLELEAIAYPGANQKVYPPSAHVSSIRMANAQRAIVTHNADPLKMGRVRVRYCWQAETEDPSPWIRMAQPMASQDSGFRFLPEAGDEAVINYENGNIERPYVEGMLFSAERRPSYGHKGSSSCIFSSRNGHSIIFSDPSGESYFKSFSPALGTLSSFIPKLSELPLGSGAFKKASGGIQFTDAYGMYSISMSSDKRAISIDSPLGKVGINAYTGITISSPNGNVKIEGKNIDIVAGNNLTLRSGRNKGGIFPASRSKFGESVGNFVIGKLTLVDLSLLRTIYETFIRPIAGTLRISSKRYLCIEAGKGEAQIKGRRNLGSFRDWKTGTIAKSAFGRYTIDRQPANKVYTINIHTELENIYNGILDLFNAHKSNSVRQVGYITSYQTALSFLQNIRGASLDDFVTDANIPDAKTVFHNAQNNQEAATVSMKSDAELDALHTHPYLLRNVRERVSLINQMANLIYRNCYGEHTEDEMWEQHFPDNFVVADKKLKALIKELINPVLPSVVIDQDRTVNYVNGLGVNKEKFRKVMYTALCVLVDNQRTEDADFYVDKIERNGIGRLYFYDPQSWQRFVDGIKPTSKLDAAANFAKSTAKKLIKLDALDGMLDQYVWDSTDNGKILLSDEDGKTLQIQIGAQRTATLEPYMESRNADIPHTISEIKRVLHNLD